MDCFSSLSSPPPMLALEETLWQQVILQRCGLYFSDSRLRLLRQSLWERMRLHHIHSYQAYYHYMIDHEEGKHEWQEVLGLLLNHETSFFRHTPSFTALRDLIFPHVFRAKIIARDPYITLWSAGCSLGQEAYSLAMALLDFVASAMPRWDNPARDKGRMIPRHLKVFGSDISLQVLDRARLGQYKAHEMRHLPDIYQQRYCQKSGEGYRLRYQIVPQVQELVEFSYVNLIDPASYPTFPAFSKGGADIIFCQNVLIYFQRDRRTEIVHWLCQRLNPGGYLFLGPAEVVGLRLPDVQSMRLPDVLVYQRLP